MTLQMQRQIDLRKIGIATIAVRMVCARPVPSFVRLKVRL